MNGLMDGVPDVVIQAALLALAVALALAFVRLVRGPSLMDRVVALELIASLVAGFVAVYAIGTDEPALIDVAIAHTFSAHPTTTYSIIFYSLTKQH